MRNIPFSLAVFGKYIFIFAEGKSKQKAGKCKLTLFGLKDKRFSCVFTVDLDKIEHMQSMIMVFKDMASLYLLKKQLNFS